MHAELGREKPSACLMLQNNSDLNWAQECASPTMWIFTVCEAKALSLAIHSHTDLVVFFVWQMEGVNSCFLATLQFGWL